MAESLMGDLEHGTHPTSCGSTVSFHHNASKHPNAGAASPILILTHGYPESSLIWRHIVPQLTKDFALFVPDQVGYGHSTPSTKGNDRLTCGTALIEAFMSVYGAAAPSTLQVILVGHDRGGRTMHRLAVDKDKFGQLNVLGLVVFDIVPFVAEFASFANPLAAKGYFHWAFLPNVDLAVPMIMAYGGGKFCRDICARGVGPSPQGRKLFFEDAAVDEYVKFFDTESVTRASAEDYASGAAKDYTDQAHDQSISRKLQVPTMVVFSEYNLGRQFNVEEVWKDYVAPGIPLQVHGIGGDRGHFIVEEAPSECLKWIQAFASQFK